MIRRWLFGTLVAVIPLVAAETRKTAPEPKLLSIYPLTATAGRAYNAVVRERRSTEYSPSFCRTGTYRSHTWLSP